MSNRSKYPAQSGGSIGREYFEIKIKGGGAGAPTVLAGASWLDISTPAAHVGGTNVITVKLRDPWLEVIAHSVDVRDDAGNGAYASIGTFANESSASSTPVTFKIQTFTSGGAASNDSTLVIVAQLALRNSIVTAGN